MPSTVNQAFSEFLQEIEPSETDNEKIIKRHNFVREQLRGRIINDGRIADFLSGSYIRHTLIRPIDDIDIVVVFDRQEYWDKYASTPQNFLRFLKMKLKEIFPTSNLETQTHSIRLNFTESPEVDVVPAFIERYDQQNNLHILKIPDKEFTQYILTSPQSHREIISKHNEYLQKKFIPTVKILKAWKCNAGIKFKSFHLEMFARKIFQQPIKNFQTGISEFFQKAAIEIRSSCMDPCGLSGDLSEYLDESQKIQYAGLFSKIACQSQDCLRLELKGDNQRAITGWRDILGNPFPKELPNVSSEPRSSGTGRTTQFPAEGKNPYFGV